MIFSFRITAMLMLDIIPCFPHPSLFLSAPFISLLFFIFIFYVLAFPSFPSSLPVPTSRPPAADQQPFVVFSLLSWVLIILLRDLFNSCNCFINYCFDLGLSFMAHIFPVHVYYLQDTCGYPFLYSLKYLYVYSFYVTPNWVSCIFLENQKVPVERMVGSSFPRIKGFLSCCYSYKLFLYNLMNLHSPISSDSQTKPSSFLPQLLHG